MGKLVCYMVFVSLANGAPKFNSDPRDIKSIERAAYVCATDARYINTPLLKHFIKRENGVYWAICADNTKKLGKGHYHRMCFEKELM